MSTKKWIGAEGGFSNRALFILSATHRVASVGGSRSFPATLALSGNARHVSPLTTTAYTHPSDEEVAARLRALSR